MLADNELLRRYCAERSEGAFAELVQRHADLVYGAALRQLNGNADLARDVAQMVFTDLALKAASLANHRSLVGWLYTSTRFAGTNLMRSEQRRLAREQEVIRMEKPCLDSSSTDDPARLRPMIDDAMHELDDADVLVTPTLIDAAGNRLHPGEQFTTDVSAGATHPISTRPNGPVEPVKATGQFYRASPER